MSDVKTNIIHQSLKRCNQNPRFLAIFYEKFLSASPEIHEMFANTDMTRQIRMVEASLYTSILAADDVPYAIHTIRHIGQRHADLGVTPDMYKHWLDSLMATLAACDPVFDEQVEAGWRTVLRLSIDMMLEQYGE